MSDPYIYLTRLLREHLGLTLDEPLSGHVGQRGLVWNFLDMQLASVFQPVRNAAGDIIARKACLRSSLRAHGELSPLAAFEQAEQAGRLVPFDRLVRTLHLLNHLRSDQPGHPLLLPVHPGLIAEVDAQHGQVFEHILHYYAVSTTQVILEVAANAVTAEIKLRQAIHNYRSLGYRVAVSDFKVPQNLFAQNLRRERRYQDLISNTGYLELERILALQPDVVKLDPEVIHAAEPQMATVLPALVHLLQERGVQVWVTGIETAAQLELARQSGADWLQGYFLDQPDFPTATPVKLAA